MSKGIGISGSGGPLGFPHREKVKAEPADVIRADSAESIAEACALKIINAGWVETDKVLAAKFIRDIFIRIIKEAEERGLERAAKWHEAMARDYTKRAEDKDQYTPAENVKDRERGAWHHICAEALRALAKSDQTKPAGPKKGGGE